MPHIIIGGNVTHPIIQGTLLEVYESFGQILGRWFVGSVDAIN